MQASPVSVTHAKWHLTQWRILDYIFIGSITGTKCQTTVALVQRRGCLRGDVPPSEAEDFWKLQTQMVPFDGHF